MGERHKEAQYQMILEDYKLKQQRDPTIYLFECLKPHRNANAETCGSTGMQITADIEHLQNSTSSRANHCLLIFNTDWTET